MPSSSFQNAAKVRHSMIYGTKRRILDLLVRPVGVINGILIGYVRETLYLSRRPKLKEIFTSQLETITQYLVSSFSL